MKKSLKNKEKKDKSAHTINKSTKKVTKVAKKKKDNTKTFLSQAEELFASLSLTPDEEHELLQNLFVSALATSIQRKERKKSLPFEKHIIVQSNSKDVQAGLAKAEEKISRALNGSDNTDSDKEDDLSNRTYAQPKYKNVESILKYNETPDDKSVVKLVIMNFND